MLCCVDGAGDGEMVIMMAAAMMNSVFCNTLNNREVTVECDLCEKFVIWWLRSRH